MAYGLYLNLDQDRWYRGDYSSENKLTGTIYTDIQQNTAKDLTGYTLTVRLYKTYRWGDFFGKTATIVTAASGTWSYAVASGEMPPPGIYLVKVELSKSGVVESTINHQELYVIEGPNA